MTTTTEDKVCPVCGDNYETDVSQLRPVWSEHHDNIVCVDCAESVEGWEYEECVTCNSGAWVNHEGKCSDCDEGH